MMDGIPQAWLDELNDQFALVTDPEGAPLFLMKWPMPLIVGAR